MAQTKKRRSSDWWCLSCKRPLKNEREKGKRKDTVTPTIKDSEVYFRHDGCGGVVSAG